MLIVLTGNSFHCPARAGAVLLFVLHWRSRTVFLNRKACLDPRQRGLRNTSPQITQPLTHPDPVHIEENSPPQLQISIQLPHRTVNVIPKQRY